MTTLDAPSSPAAAAGVRVWGFMYALGREGPPRRVGVAGRPLRLERVVKHDCWAATAFYLDEATCQRIVVKFGRSRRMLGLTMRWAGRWLTRRESRFYRRLTDVEQVPAWLGEVDGPLIGFAHAFAVGRPMSEVPPERLTPAFFNELEDVLGRLHERGIAYVDLNKPQNVLVDDRGRPVLIDFQISYDAHAPGVKRWLLPAFVRNTLLRHGIRADRHHLLKHKRRQRPDLLSALEWQELDRTAWFIRLHRTLTRPYFLLRRRMMAALRRTGRLLPEGSK